MEIIEKNKKLLPLAVLLVYFMLLSIHDWSSSYRMVFFIVFLGLEIAVWGAREPSIRAKLMLGISLATVVLIFALQYFLKGV